MTGGVLFVAANLFLIGADYDDFASTVTTRTFTTHTVLFWLAATLFLPGLIALYVLQSTRPTSARRTAAGTRRERPGAREHRVGKPQNAEKRTGSPDGRDVPPRCPIRCPMASRVQLRRARKSECAATFRDRPGRAPSSLQIGIFCRRGLHRSLHCVARIARFARCASGGRAMSGSRIDPPDLRRVVGIHPERAEAER
jgi:hypothetical protein